MFRITSAEFITGAARSEQFPNTPFPEIAFAGRSNVGKSSLLNLLVGRKALAKTSATPGKTQQINFFRVNDRLQFVDLPGYGFAKVSKEDREAWARLIESYLMNRDQLRLVVSLVDIRHEPTALDRDMLAWLEAEKIPFLVVLTKLDKVSAAQATQRIEEMSKLVGHASLCRGVHAVSSSTREGRDRLLSLLGAALES